MIKPRFESGLIDLLQRLRWWDLEGEELAKLLPLIRRRGRITMADQVQRILA